VCRGPADQERVDRDDEQKLQNIAKKRPPPRTADRRPRVANDDRRTALLGDAGKEL